MTWLGRRAYLGLGLAVTLLASSAARAEGPAPAGARDFGEYLSQLDPGEERWFARQLRQLRTYRHLDRANELVDAGRVAEARRELEQSLAQDPGNLKTRYAYVVLLARVPDHPEVARQASLLLRERPSFVPALLYRAGASEALGRPDDAIRDYRAVAGSERSAPPDRLFASSAVADLEIRTERHAEALATLAALSKQQDTFAHRYRQGLVLERLGRLEDAAEAYRRAVELASAPGERLQAHRARGEVATRRGDWSTAREALLAAKEVAPRDAAVRRALANVAAARGEVHEAIRWTQEALALDATPEGRESLAHLLYRAQDYRGAVREFTRLLEELPAEADRHRIYLALGRAHTMLEDFRSAAEALRSAARIQDDQPTLTALAEALERDGKLAEARREAETILRRWPSREAHLKVAVLQTRLGAHAEAARHFEAATRGDLSVVPVSAKAEIHKQQGFVYYRLGRYADARSAFEKALALSRGDLALYLALGETALRAGAPRTTADYLTRALRLSRLSRPQRAEVLERLGLVYMELDEHRPAVETLRKALDAGRDTCAVRQTLGFALVKLEEWEQSLAELRAAAARC